MTRSNDHSLRLFLAAIAALCVGACSSDKPEPPAESPTAADIQEEAADATEAAQDAAEQAVEDAEAVIDETLEAISEAVDPADGDAPANDGGPCELSVEVGDSIAFSVNALAAPSNCSEVTVTLTHTGKLPAAAMGHNWVLLPTDAIEAISMAGMNAGAEANYLPDDERIVAATKIIGGGESASVTFSLDALDADTSYTYVCTFPGHWSVMRGSFTVTG